MLLHYWNRCNFVTGMNQYVAVYFNISFTNGLIKKNQIFEKNGCFIYIKFVERIDNHVPQSPNAGILEVTSLAAYLKFMLWRMFPGASHRPHLTPSIMLRHRLLCVSWVYLSSPGFLTCTVIFESGKTTLPQRTITKPISFFDYVSSLLYVNQILQLHFYNPSVVHLFVTIASSQIVHVQTKQ